MRYSVLVIASIVMGCGSSEPRHEGASAATPAEHAHGDHAPGDHAPGDHAAAGPQPTRVLEDGSRLFGAELSDRAPVALSAIAASPGEYAGQVVRTEGTIERVCQRMGCWMELRGENAPTIRVPMAGHAFFLPSDATGRTATIEGTVSVQELDADTRAHLESEGALATASALSIDATGVIVH